MSTGIYYEKPLDPFCQVTKSNLDKIKDGNALRLFMIMWATWANMESKECWPKISTIAEQTGYSEFQTRKHISYLVDIGVIKVISCFRPDGSQTSNKYVLANLSETDAKICGEYQDEIVPEYENTQKTDGGGFENTEGGGVKNCTPRGLISQTGGGVKNCTPITNTQSLTNTHLTNTHLTTFVEETSTVQSGIQQVFDHWKQIMGSTRSVLDKKRTRLISQAVERYGIEACMTAIDNVKASEWHMGANDRKQKYNTIELIFRDAEKTERFIAMKPKEYDPGDGWHSDIMKNYARQSESKYQENDVDIFAIAEKVLAPTIKSINERKAV